MDALIEFVIDAGAESVVVGGGLVLLLALVAIILARQVGNEALRKRGRYSMLGDRGEVAAIDQKVYLWKRIVPFVILVLGALVVIWMS